MSTAVPEQNEGGKMDITANIALATTEDARAFYQTAKQRLLAVYNWYEICAVPVSTFMLTDPHGREIKRPVQEGDYFKIDIPGPGTSTGDGFDWVRVESIEEESLNQADTISMTVRPAANPLNEKEDTAHFFKDTATSTFQVKRIGNEVYAEVHGRNELANTDTDQMTDNIRNTLVGWSAKLGLSAPQWKSLVTGLVKKQDGN
ncbi:hypothetical protein [Pedobacter immunditicola]|uniref:hypothetical protein n=1 Tax=Pedobacter immunditicola TaxID=3133440 RepID=UPI0030981DCD